MVSQDRRKPTKLCAQIWVSAAVHMKGVRHKQDLFLTLPHQGIEPRVFGLEAWRSTTYLCPSSSATTYLCPSSSAPFKKSVCIVMIRQCITFRVNKLNSSVTMMMMEAVSSRTKIKERSVFAGLCGMHAPVCRILFWNSMPSGGSYRWILGLAKPQTKLLPCISPLWSHYLSWNGCCFLGRWCFCCVLLLVLLPISRQRELPFQLVLKPFPWSTPASLPLAQFTVEHGFWHPAAFHARNMPCPALKEHALNTGKVGSAEDFSICNVVLPHHIQDGMETVLVEALQKSDQSLARFWSILITCILVYHCQLEWHVKGPGCCCNDEGHTVRPWKNVSSSHVRHTYCPDDWYLLNPRTFCNQMWYDIVHHHELGCHTNSFWF